MGIFSSQNGHFILLMKSKLRVHSNWQSILIFRNDRDKPEEYFVDGSGRLTTKLKRQPRRNLKDKMLPLLTEEKSEQDLQVPDIKEVSPSYDLDCFDGGLDPMPPLGSVSDFDLDFSEFDPMFDDLDLP